MKIENAATVLLLLGLLLSHWLSGVDFTILLSGVLCCSGHRIKEAEVSPQLLWNHNASQ